ncbi:MAG: hypothetical protein ABSH16_09420 [Sedimentisphaerales bacterium]
MNRFCGGYAVELVWSPIGLVMRVYDLSPTADRTDEGVALSIAMKSQICGDYFDVCHLMFRQRPPPRPP